MAYTLPTFRITELKRDGTGAYIATPVAFAWDQATRTIPEGVWEWHVKQRTVREEYGHGVEPTEQVLGRSFQPFTLKGEWNDHYAGAGYANRTWQAFEDMVSRGGLVRIEMDEIVFHGIITDFIPAYYRRTKVGYTFTLSPHYRRKPGDEFGVTAQAPQSSMKDFSAEINRLVAIALVQHAALRTDRQRGSLLGTVGKVSSLLLGMFDAAAGIERQITGYAKGVIGAPAAFASGVATGAEGVASGARAIAALAPPSAVVAGPLVSYASRLSSSFATIRGQAVELLTATRDVQSIDLEAYPSVVDVLSNEAWVRGIRSSARLIALKVIEADRQIRLLDEAKILALYRPRKGQSLYEISDIFYSTARNWRLIWNRNGLTSFGLTGLELLIIPHPTRVA